jgi:hypothetical protein
VGQDAASKAAAVINSNVSAHCIMTPIDNIENIYLEYFKQTFDTLGLNKYERSNYPGRGGCIKFKNKAFRLQLLGDRGIIESDISPLHGDEQFMGIEKYNSLLKLRDSKNKITETEKRIILRTRLDYNSQATFLADNFDQLKELLTKSNYKRTLREIENVWDKKKSNC